MAYKFFDKKASCSGIKSMLNQQIAVDLLKPVIKKLKRRKVYSSFKDNIWDDDLDDIQLTTKFNKSIRFLLCAIDLFSKYTWVIPLKDAKGVTIVKAFQRILNDSKRKPSKVWVHKGSEFYNRSMKSWLQDIETYIKHNEGKSVVAKRFIRTLKSRVYKYVNSIQLNVC